jgi:primosomal protein N' (replication factor Y)
MDNIAVVVINGCTREFDRQYHYLVPESLCGKILPGIRVAVPFGGGNGLKEGYVFDLVGSSEYKNLKEIKKALDEKPVLSRSMLELAAWMRERYICTYSDAVKCMLPAGTSIKSLRVVKPIKRAEGLDKNKQRIMEALFECRGGLEYDELKEMTGVRGFSKCIAALERDGLVCVCEEYTAAVREKTVRAAYLAMPAEEVLDDIENNRIKKIQHIRILEMLIENEYISVADIVRFAGVSAGVLDTLRKYGYLNYKDIEVKRDPLVHKNVERTFPLPPTGEQEAAMSAIMGKLDGGGFSETLVHGVTGSGKTELYLRLIKHVMDSDRQAIVLVPEISLTPQMVERFRGRFGSEVAVLHSRLSLGERYDQWRLIREGSIKVAVGARSAVFAPFDRLGIIIIDEEHEGSYKSETTPKYSAVDIARKRCLDGGAALVLGSATPSVVTFFRADKGETALVKLNERANRMVMPHVHIADMRKELEEGNRTPFSVRLSAEISRNIDAGQQTILFLNRRGYASFVLCRSCGYTVRCPHCSISMTYHSFDDRLICHYCGFTTLMPKTCPKCASAYIRQFGTGTQKVEEELKKHFPGCSVLRMDMDTTTGKNSHEQILRTFREQNVNLLVGTQMIAKGHDFPNVTLVGVLAADSLLNLDDFRASERTFQLLTQVSGRAGRGKLPGRVVIQTYNTEDFSILAACGHDYAAFYSQEIKVREELNYPPFTNLASLIVSSVNDKLAYARARETRDILNQRLDGCRGGELLLGPSRAPVAKIKNRYRWRIIIKCPSMERLIEVLTVTSDDFRKLNGKREADLSVDINPNSMI